MNEHFVLDAVIDAVPEWYGGLKAPWTSELVLGSEKRTVGSHRPPSPELAALLEYVKDHLQEWHRWLREPVSPSQVASIRKSVTLEWLRLHDTRVDWPRLFAYMEYLKDRTYEDRILSRNLVITPGAGGADITSLSLQKVLDPLASSGQVYLRVDPNLRFLGYEEISWDDIGEAPDYTYSVDFLRPFSCCVAQGGYLAHLTQRREIVVLGQPGLTAVERRNRWCVHESATLRESLVDIFGNRHIGSNLYEVIVDLSYRRHGALLVYDPAHTVLDHVINKEAVLEPEGRPDDVHRMLTPAAKQISLGCPCRAAVKKRLLMEMAGLDGAVIFDADSILAFGAMIRTHPDAGGVVGARTTAAVSAYLDGGTPVKISSDGDVCILFSEGSGFTLDEQAMLQFF